MRPDTPNLQAVPVAGRPVIYVAHVLKPDYSDAAWPYWRLGIEPATWNHTHCVEGTWGAEIIDELKPHDGEHLIVKKGFGGFANTALDTTLRNMGVTTCVMVGVTTCVCVSNTVRGGVEHNYRMILVSDAVAEVSRDTHGGELQTMSRIFADVRTTGEVKALLGLLSTELSRFNGPPKRDNSASIAQTAGLARSGGSGGVRASSISAQ